MSDQNEEVEFNPNYMDSLVTKSEHDEVKNVVRLLITGDEYLPDVSGLVIATLLTVLENSTVVNYTNDSVVDAVTRWQGILKEYDLERFNIGEVDNIVIDVGDLEYKKIIAKGIFKIAEVDYIDDEFSQAPLLPIFGNIDDLAEYLEAETLIYYSDSDVDGVEHALWKYIHQPDVIGQPDDYIVLYGENEVEIIKDATELLTNYKLPTLEGLLEE